MSSSSSSLSRNWVYDVFPSFSGEDVRIRFLSHFLRELDRKLIVAFKDNKIEKSESLDPVLKQAIKDSRIVVVVFSKNYASSSWCLNELLEIVKCKEEFGQLVIPVFYDLDPSHIRKQTGEFGEIFRNTCQSKREDEVQLYRKALTDVANLVGYHSEKWHDEAKMIEAIASGLLGKLNLTPPNDFDEFVGIEDHIANMSELLRLESEVVRMVGIWGPSGIGKTTIARALHVRLRPRFQCNVFIDRAFVSKSKEIYSRGYSDDYGMKLHLQGNLLSKILGKNDIKIDHLGAVRDRLKHQKVLIVIDDLDDQVVLEALAGQCQWFGSGSRIIVVTNDKHLLTAHEIKHIYEVDLPSEHRALEMLCRSAFNQNSPPEGFKKLAVEVTIYAGSLPLGLNVLGSSLRGKKKEYWTDMLPRLRNGLDGKIEKTLRVSYDGLGSEKDKTIFRHIACFFNYDTLTYIETMLADSDLGVKIGLQNLAEKSLIHVRWRSWGQEVEMHRLLKETGRNVVRKQAIDEPGKREFLLEWKDIYEVLNENTGTKKVLGISLDMIETNDELHVHENAFRGMPNLRFLTIATWWKEGQLQLPESFDYLPPKLKLLCWSRYPMRCLPSKFCPEFLVELKMRDSKLEKLWDGVLPLTCLKTMDLFGSENLKEIPDLSKAINLKILSLDWCSSLVELPLSIGNLHRLTDLYMIGCTNLEILPTGINLKSLGCLDLTDCWELRSFPDISTNISELHLSRTGIEEVPWWIEKFSRLRELFMHNCWKLKFVSPNITKLKHLSSVDFSYCGALTEVDLSGNSSDQRSMEEANIDTKSLVSAEASSSSTKHVFNFFDCSSCFSLDQEALLKQQSVVFYSLILTGEEVPSYFTHQTTGTSSLTIPLLHTSLLQQPFWFRTCVYVDFDSCSFQDPMKISMKVNWWFKDRQGDQSDSTDQHRFRIYYGTRLVVSDYIFYPPQPNYDHVDIQLSNENCIIKGWGIRLVDSSLETEPGNPNILPQVCKANMVSDGCLVTEQGVECEGSKEKQETNADYTKKRLTSPRGTYNVILKYKEGMLNRFRKLIRKIKKGACYRM